MSIAQAGPISTVAPGLASYPSDLPQGPRFSVAHRLDEVLAAWRLVYRSYLSTGLVDDNPARLHTMHQAVGPQVAVICARVGESLAGTMTVMADSARGLPLDSVYPAELDHLREQGRTLVEVGLFAEDRQLTGGCLDHVFDLMRWAFHAGRARGADDLIIGVHPHHARFYERFVGFEPFAPTGLYPTVNHNPVVPMRLDIHARLAQARRPRGLQYFLDNVIAPSAYSNAYAFPMDDLIDSPISEFFRARRRLVN